MAQTFEFPGSSDLPHRRLHRAKRALGDKFQEIAMRSPRDMDALEVLADLVLARLNEQDRALRH
jgi:hypothetical protein